MLVCKSVLVIHKAIFQVNNCKMIGTFSDQPTKNLINHAAELHYCCISRLKIYVFYYFYQKAHSNLRTEVSELSTSCQQRWSLHTACPALRSNPVDVPKTVGRIPPKRGLQLKGVQVNLQRGTGADMRAEPILRAMWQAIQKVWREVEQNRNEVCV